MSKANFFTSIFEVEMITFKFLSTLCVLVLAFHIAWTSVVVSALSNFYKHRIFDIGKIENVGDHWESFTSAFVAQAMNGSVLEKKPLTMFVGSSVTYGFPWQERVIFTKYIANELRGWKVSNLSIIGVGTRAITDFATCALNPSYRPSVLIVEIPLVNSTSSLEPGVEFPPRKCLYYSGDIPSYWSLVMSHPYGTGWASILWDENAYEKQDVDLLITPLPSTYFADKKRFDSIQELYIVEVRRFLDSVSRMGDKVFIYVSPISTPAITAAGGDRAAVEYQIELTNKICSEYKNLTCLDSSIFNERPELFYNLTHLNHRGHRALADWFMPHIAPQAPSVAPQRPPSLTN
jgi:hypothetical protein